jgi:hypothetical protein
MPPFKPTKRNDLIKALKKAGFEGPYYSANLIIL